MRLISMSIHARLRNKKEILEEYTQEIAHIRDQLQAQENAAETPNYTAQQKIPVIILIGSQKGLCGTLNQELFKFAEQTKNITAQSLIITVGKYASDYVIRKGITPYAQFDKFSMNNYIHIAQQVTQLLITLDHPLVTVLSNKPRTFFVQKPHQQDLLITYDAHAPANLVNTIELMHIKVSIMYALHEALYAEQAARFLSMDSSTRNAETLLIQTKIDYNKARQANITRELTELSASSQLLD